MDRPSQFSLSLSIPIIFLLVVSIGAPTSSLLFAVPSHVLYQFPNGTWVENLAVRSNGDILVTLLTVGDLYIIDTSPTPTARLVHAFPVSGLLGIAELEHDLFYVAGRNITFTGSMPNISSVWEVDMRSFSKSGARVRKVTAIPEAVLLNGLVALSPAENTILIADSGLGVIWRVNVKSGAYSIAISDPLTAPVPTAALAIGVNGVKIRDGNLYFTNTNQGLTAYVPISTDGTTTGKVEVLATGIAPDDFDLDCEGRAWIAQNTLNKVSVLLRNGTVVDYVGATDQLTVAGVTSCLVKIAPSNRGGERKGAPILYCTTAGGLASPVNGTVTEGGKVVVIGIYI